MFYFSICSVILFSIGYIYNYYVNPIVIKVQNQLSIENQYGQIVEINQSSWKLIQTVNDEEDNCFLYQKIDSDLLNQVISFSKYQNEEFKIIEYKNEI